MTWNKSMTPRPLTREEVEEKNRKILKEDEEYYRKLKNSDKELEEAIRTGKVKVIPSVDNNE
jgi:hypothetical protein